MYIQVPRGNGFHAFRHASATLMGSFGASQKLRQKRLGHADGSPVTESIYTHVISEDGKRVGAQLGNAVWGILDQIKKTAREWSLLSRLGSTRKWLRGSDLNSRPSGYEGEFAIHAIQCQPTRANEINAKREKFRLV
jgi:hypothetical protein